MFKKKELKQDTILGICALVFMGVLLIMTWINERVPAKLYKRGAGK